MSNLPELFRDITEIGSPHHGLYEPLTEDGLYLGGVWYPFEVDCDTCDGRGFTVGNMGSAAVTRRPCPDCSGGKRRNPALDDLLSDLGYVDVSDAPRVTVSHGGSYPDPNTGEEREAEPIMQGRDIEGCRTYLPYGEYALVRLSEPTKENR